MTTDCHSPNKHHDSILPSHVLHAIEKTLEIERFTIQKPQSGTNNRTYLLVTQNKKWVIRIESPPAAQLKRAHFAQQKAKSVGVRTPETIAHDLENTQQAWMLEEYVKGVEFQPQILGASATATISTDIGQQLRQLHSIEMDVFGLLPPRPYPVYQNMHIWIEHRAVGIEQAVRTVNLPSAQQSTIWNRLEFSRQSYVGPPKFCKGDLAGSNLLVESGRLAAIIDWEWACGSDPASEVAYWYFWHPDSEALDRLIEGYQPPNAEQFYQRVLAYLPLTALNLINVYGEQNDAEGIQFCHAKLQDYLNRT